MDRNETGMDRNETGMDRNETGMRFILQNTLMSCHVNDWFSKKHFSVCLFLSSFVVGWEDEVAFAMIFLIILSTRSIGKQPL